MYLKVEPRPWARVGWAALGVCTAGLVVSGMLWGIRRGRQRKVVLSGAVERDTVDESSWQSFPASDPPGWIPT